MLKFMSGVLQIVCGIILAAFIMTIMFICIATPEKTKHGTYTDIYKYWTDDIYLCRNFKCDANLVKNKQYNSKHRKEQIP